MILKHMRARFGARRFRSLSSVYVAAVQSPLRKKIVANRTAIQKEISLKTRLAHSSQTPIVSGKVPDGLDSIASTVFKALKNGAL